MKLHIICVGKVKEEFYRDLVLQHSESIGKSMPFTIWELPDLKIPKNASEKENQKIKEQEGKEILKKIPARAYVIALCIEGKEINSSEHKRIFESVKMDGYEDIVYIIGGSLGLSQDVVDRANYKLSFSKMTFPHQMMRVMLAEELARIVKR